MKQEDEKDFKNWLYKESPYEAPVFLDDFNKMKTAFLAGLEAGRKPTDPITCNFDNLDKESKDKIIEELKKPQSIMVRSNKPSGHVEDYKKLYSELIMAVEGKYEGETRHQTALRYIKETENPTDSPENERPAKIVGHVERGWAIKTTEGFEYENSVIFSIHRLKTSADEALIDFAKEDKAKIVPVEIREVKG
jgi:hypothetical protein